MKLPIRRPVFFLGLIVAGAIDLAVWQHFVALAETDMILLGILMILLGGTLVATGVIGLIALGLLDCYRSGKKGLMSEGSKLDKKI